MQKKLFGKVIHGLGRGKGFGFPTINIELINNTLHIETGVYAVTININNQSFNGMLYVGTRPTLNLQETTYEIHVFEFNEDVYDQQISFQILHKIRDEIRFETIENLIEQLHQDKEMVYKFINH